MDVGVTLRSRVILPQLTTCKFQETHFATRSLVFIDGKVNFNCQAVSDWQEHLFETESEIKGEQAGSRGPFQGDDIGEFEGLIQDFSGRVLSYNTDVYSAFSGVARQLSVRMDTNLVHGLPARYFDWFLLWGPLDDQTESTQRKLGVEGTRPSTYSEDILSQDPGSGFLQFWTVSISLRLAESTSNEDDVGPKHNRRRLGIFGRNGQELGTISVHSWWLEKNAIPQVREFILLCEGRDKRAEHGRIDDDEGWRYMVMLIEWHGEYAERVAIGSIGKEALKEDLGDGIRWKKIVLG
ncbi:hypothetical protein DL764_001823 [Monosporascus ibericus]|uniref:Heterokaryon incompatibility domain-containing protein n=1 Tax=Monosporascus ibericus TaxID=155417 RepID=A0A4Q4TPI2_9PEZI|nr:hypothetical protein DL764_001823 [Monosporascus ibericus]